MRHARTVWLGHCLVVIVAASGCSSTVAKPQILHPGTFGYQRWRAEVFDPYPEPNVGPEDPGMRPPWYTTPAPEPQRTGASLLNRFGPEPPKLLMSTP